MTNVNLGVLPGTYTLSLSDGDRRCWSEVVKKISVSADVKDIVFKQTGYNVQVNYVLLNYSLNLMDGKALNGITSSNKSRISS